MRGRKTLIFGAITVLSVVVVAATIPTLHNSSPTFNWLFSPSDLYEPLAVSAIDLAKEGQSTKVHFENRYPGLHWFAIQVANPQPVAIAYEGDFVLRLEVHDEGELVLSELINGPGNPFWSHKSGFVVQWYRSPDDLPLRESLEAEITVVRSDQAFVDKHGVSEIVVRKLSDE